MIFFDDAAVFSHADPAAIVASLRHAFSNPGHTPPRMHEDFPGSAEAKLLIMPCWSGPGDWLGVKVATVIPSNPTRSRPTIDGSYMLLDGRTGELHAVLSAPALTSVRTAGMSALAASLLAREDARTLLMIGTGALAPHLVRAHCSVRPIERVILWGRDSRKARSLAAKLADLPVSIEIASRLPDVLGQADIVSSATLARAPLIEGNRITAGAHVDLVGSFTPAMREADSDLFRRGRLVVDTEVAFRESGDLLAPVADGILPSCVPTLPDVLRAPGLERRGVGEITIFKSVGTGIADLAVACHVLDTAARGHLSTGANL